MMSNPDFLKNETLRVDKEKTITFSSLENNLAIINKSIDFPTDSENVASLVALFDNDKETVFAKFLANNTKLESTNNKLTATATEEKVLKAFCQRANEKTTKSSAEGWGLHFASDMVLAYCGACGANRLVALNSIEAVQKEITEQLNAVNVSVLNSDNPTPITGGGIISPETQEIQNILKEADISFTLYGGVNKKDIVDAVNKISNPTKKSDAILFLKAGKVQEFQKDILELSGTGATGADGKFGKYTLIALQGLKTENITSAVGNQDDEVGDITKTFEDNLAGMENKVKTTSSATSGSSVSYISGGSNIDQSSAAAKTEIEKNKSKIQSQIDQNIARIAQLTQQIQNFDQETQTIIDKQVRAFADKGKIIDGKSIQEYKDTRKVVLANMQREVQALEIQNGSYQEVLNEEEFLSRDEASIDRYITTVHQDTVRMSVSGDTGEFLSHQNKAWESEVIVAGKTPKKNKRALQWMIDGKGGIDPIVEKATSEERKALKEVVKVVNKIDLLEAVNFMDTYWTTTKKTDTVEQRVVTLEGKYANYPKLSKRDKKEILQFARYYFDYHKNVSIGTNPKTPVNQFMFQLITGARAGMSPLDIYKNKRGLDMVDTALDTQHTTLSEKPSWLSPAEEKLLGLLGDTNMDGKVQGVGGEVQKKKYQLDVGTVFGTQILSAYQSAKLELGMQYPDTKEQDKILIQNLFSLLLTQQHKIYKTDTDFQYFMQKKGLSWDVQTGEVTLPDNLKTFDGVVKFFATEPALFSILRQSLNKSNEYLTQAFLHGAKYADDHLQREKDAIVPQPEVVPNELNSNAVADALQTGETIQTPEGWNREVEKKISEEYEKYLQDLLKGIEEQKRELTEQIAKENDPTKKQELQEKLDALNADDFKNSLDLLNNEQNKKEKIKKMRIDFVGLAFQHFKYANGSQSNSLGVGMNMTFDKFNNRLQKGKVFDKFSLAGGVGFPFQKEGGKWSPVVGLAATFTGSQDLRKGGSLIYAAGAGAGYGVAGFTVGPFVSVGIDQQILSGMKKGKLDAKSAHYLGLIANASLSGWGFAAYWRRDKLTGIENQAADVIKPALTNIITKATTLKSGESLTLEGITRNLSEEFSKEKQSFLPFAHDVYTALKPYEHILKSNKQEDNLAKQKVYEQLAEVMTMHWLNQNKTELAKKGFHLSGLSAGLQFVSGWLPMPVFGVSFTKYINLRFKDDAKSVARQKETLQKGYGSDLLSGLDFGTMANNLNATLKRKYESLQSTENSKTSSPNFLEYDEGNSLVRINKKILEDPAKINLHILPELKPFLAQNDDYIYIPADIPVSFVNAINANTTQYHLILGSVGLENTKVLQNSAFSTLPQYDSITFNNQLVGLGEIFPVTNDVEQQTTMTKITKEFLDIPVKRQQFERKLQRTLGRIPGVSNITIPLDKITADNFTIAMDFQGKHETFSIPFDKLGTILFKTNLKGTSTMVEFVEGVKIDNKIPQLNIKQQQEVEAVISKPMTPEKLRDSVSSEVLKYFRTWDASDVIIRFRTQNVNAFNAFYDNVEKAGTLNTGYSYEKAAALFKKYLDGVKDPAITDAIKNAFTPNADKLQGNVNFIYAALSRVRKTQYKQFGGVERTNADRDVAQAEYMVDARKDLLITAKTLIAQLPVSGNNKTKLEGLVAERIIHNADNFAEIKEIIGSPSNLTSPQGPKDNLYCMLMGLKELAGTRDAAFVSRLKNEKINGKKISTETVTAITNTRNTVKNSLNFPFDHAKEWEGTGLVFGYDHGQNAGGHHKKFINSPLIIQKEKNNVQALKDSGIKEYFLRNLVAFQPKDNILAKTAEQLNTYVEVNLEKKDADITPSKIVDHLLDPENHPLYFENGANHIKFTLNTDFHMGFFADCINEALLMESITITPEGIIRDYSGTGDGITTNEYRMSKGGVYINGTNTVVNADVSTITAGAAVIVGEQKKEKENPGSSTNPETEESRTEVVDLDLTEDQLNQLKEVGGFPITIEDYTIIPNNDGTYTVLSQSLGEILPNATYNPNTGQISIIGPNSGGVSVDQAILIPPVNSGGDNKGSPIGNVVNSREAILGVEGKNKNNNQK